MAPWPEKTNETIVVSRAPLPEKPFATIEQRLEAAQEVYKESVKTPPKTKDTPSAPAPSSSPSSSTPWNERLAKMRDAHFPEKGSTP